MENLDFKTLNLGEKVLKAIDSMGFETPSQIQAEAIPAALAGSDIIGQAQTGTGKTLAFGAPIIDKLTKSKDKKVGALILTPTRELAIQITDELNRIAKYAKLVILPVYGGQPIDRQIRALTKGVDIVVGTPGRILDLLNRKNLNVMDIKFLVLDEGDEMLDMGFIDDIEKIIQNTNDEKQTMLFSATMPAPIRKLASRYLKADLKHIEIAKNTVTVEKIEQFYFEVKSRDRLEVLCRILDTDDPTSAIIFSNTKRQVDELVEALQARGYNVEGMHGDMNQNQRLNTLRKFKQGTLEILIATDVAARGIDVENVTHVINYELPQDLESYVHRIGRTGRANKEGTAYSLVSPREYMMLKNIERFTKSKIKRKNIPTVEDIYEVKYKGLLAKVKAVLENEEYKSLVPLAEELDNEYNLVDVAAALMKLNLDKEISYDYTENSIASEESVRLFITLGRMDNMEPRSFLDFIREASGVNTSEITNLSILEKFSFMNVPEKFVPIIMETVNGKRLKNRRISVEISNKR